MLEPIVSGQKQSLSKLRAAGLRITTIALKVHCAVYYVGDNDGIGVDAFDVVCC